MDVKKHGTWRVSTEGNVDGSMPMRVLGVYTGTIEEIAMSLSREAEYFLYFQEDTTAPDPAPPHGSVRIRYGGEFANLEW
jgi:hypothetical protein